MNRILTVLRILLIYLVIAMASKLIMDELSGDWLAPYQGWLFIAFGGLALFIAVRSWQALPSPDMIWLRMLESGLRQTTDSISVITENGQIAFVNPAFTTMTGYTASEVLGKTLHVLQGPKTDDSVFKQMRQCMVEGHPFYGETIGYRKDGREIYLEWYTVPTYNDGSHDQHFVVVQRDVTERKRTEQALLQRTNELRERVKELNCLFAISDLIEKEDQLPLETLLQDIVIVIPSGWQHPESTCARIVFQDQEFRTNNFKETSLSLSNPIIIEGRVVGKVEVNYDNSSPSTTFLAEEQNLIQAIAEHLSRVIERKLTAKQIEYQAEVLQNVSDAVISIDMDHTIRSWNRAAEMIYGWQAHEVIGKTVHSICSSGGFVQVPHQTMIATLLETGCWKGEILHKHKSGAQLNIQMSAVLLTDNDGKPTGMISTNRDITELKRMQEQVDQTERMQLELIREKELLELKERFISMVSHEFRTPLTVIVTSTDLVEKYYERLSKPKLFEHLHKIRAQSKYMWQLLDDVLLFSKGRSGKLEFTPRPMNLNTFSAALLEQMKLIDPVGHRLSFSAVGHLEAIPLDEKHLQHIMVNLLSNAMKYSPADSEIQFAVWREADEVAFRVRDHGIGIPPEDQSRLFEPFHRARNTGDIKGTGLGLAIIKRSVELHKGRIHFESAPGKGSIFTVHLPVNGLQSPDTSELVDNVANVPEVSV